MKKLLLLVLSLFMINYVYAEDVLYDINSDSISYDGTLSLNGYNNNDGGSTFVLPYDMSTWNDGHADFSIYSASDLTIDLTNTNNFTGAGICVEGDLSLAGTGILNTDLLEVYGFNIDSTCIINFNYGSSSYIGPAFSDDYNVYYLDGNNKITAMYDIGQGTYLNDIGTLPVDNLHVEKKVSLANINNLYTTSDVYNYNTVKGQYELLENVDGFIIYETGKGTKVTYDAITLTYTVEFFDDLSGNNVKEHYFELAYNPSEWGKEVNYQILEATNAYELDTSSGSYLWKDFVINKEYKQDQGHVGDRTKYSLTPGGETNIGVAFYEFGVKKNNYLSVKVIGSSGSYRYINLKITDNSTPQENNNNPIRYEIPNTSAIIGSVY